VVQTGSQVGEAGVSCERRSRAKKGQLGVNDLQKWPKFVDDFEVVLLIPKALTSIFRLKKFFIFSLFNFAPP